MDWGDAQAGKGPGALSAMHRHTGDSRLRVTIRIDEDSESTCIEVHGVVTVENVRALYVVARRVSLKLPGHEIVINLAHARVSAMAIEELRERERHSTVISVSDSSETPCRLRLVDPLVILRTKAHA